MYMICIHSIKYSTNMDINLHTHVHIHEISDGKCSGNKSDNISTTKPYELIALFHFEDFPFLFDALQSMKYHMHMVNIN